MKTLDVVYPHVAFLPPKIGGRYMRVNEFFDLKRLDSNSNKKSITSLNGYDSCSRISDKLLSELIEAGLLKRKMSNSIAFTKSGKHALLEGEAYIRYLLHNPEGASNYSLGFEEKDCWTCENHLREYFRLSYKSNLLLTLNQHLTQNRVSSMSLSFEQFMNESRENIPFSYEYQILFQENILKWYEYTSGLNQPDPSEVVTNDPYGYPVTFDDLMVLSEFSEKPKVTLFRKFCASFYLMIEAMRLVEIRGSNLPSRRHNRAPINLNIEHKSHMHLHFRGLLNMLWIDYSRKEIKYEINDAGRAALDDCMSAIASGRFTPPNGK